MGIILKQHLNDLKKLTTEWKSWILLSIVIIVIIADLIFDSRTLIDNGLIWPIAISGILLCVVWWYWVMRSLRMLVKHREDETTVLIEIVDTIKEIREEVKTLPK